MPHRYWHYDMMMTGVPRGPEPQGSVPTPRTRTALDSASSSHPLRVRTVPKEGRTGAQPSERRRQFLQDIERADMSTYWAQYSEPVPPDMGPWFRFSQGLCSFRFGVTAKEIAKEERWLARELMARGENQDPPTPDGESLIISFDDSEEGNNPNEIEAEAGEGVEVQMEAEAEAEAEEEREMEAEANVEAEEEENEEAEEGDDKSELQSTITDAPSLM